MQELKSLVTSEQLGEVYAINASNHGKNPGGWFVDRALSAVVLLSTTPSTLPI